MVRKKQMVPKKVRRREKIHQTQGKVKPMADRAETKILEALETGQTQRQMMLVEEATPDGKIISLEVLAETDPPGVVLTDKEKEWIARYKTTDTTKKK
jgi:cell wall assembly regulator SMI1